MSSFQSQIIRSFLLKPMKRLFDPEQTSIERMRSESIHKAKSVPLPRGTKVVKDTVSDTPAEWVSANNVIEGDERTIIFVHGGGTMGSCETHRSLAAQISKSTGIRTFVFEYRLAPENQYPAANEDCITVYTWLVKKGIPANRMIIGGDSWGAALALMTLLSLRDAGLPLPAAGFLLSPWDILKFDAESYVTKATIDPCCNLKGFQTTAGHYFGNVQPFSSLIEQNFHSLPPLFIQVGDHEVILEDSIRLAEKAREQGVDVTLEVWKDMWHTFQNMAFIMPEAKSAIENIGAFIKKNI